MYLFLRCLGHLPEGFAHLLAWLGYLLLYHVAGYRRSVVRANLAQAFPEWNANELTQLAKKFYRQLTGTALEIARARYLPRAEFCRRVRVLNAELLREYSDGCQSSVILLAIHQGNWEWMLHSIGAALPLALDPVYKPLHNRGADRFMLELRSRFGARPVPLADCAADVLRQRRQPRVLALVADQAPTAGERYHRTAFLNRDTAFHAGAESLARRTGFAVLFARCRRLRRGQYEVLLQPVSRHPAAEPPGAVTERYARLAEAAIQAQPESWLWSNRRWKRPLS